MIMKADPGIAWIREIRHQISEECGHDPKRLVEYFIRTQEKHKDRMVRPPKKGRDAQAMA